MTDAIKRLSAGTTRARPLAWDINSVTGCWELVSHKGVGRVGYANMRRNNKPMKAHRFAYETFVGPIPAGLYVLHHCDNPKCVNPDHLFLGTLADNSRDMVLKGRQASGEKNGRAKLNAEQVSAIRARASIGENRHSLSRRFGVCCRTIGRIIEGDIWTN